MHLCISISGRKCTEKVRPLPMQMSVADLVDQLFGECLFQLFDDLKIDAACRRQNKCAFFFTTTKSNRIIRTAVVESIFSGFVSDQIEGAILNVSLHDVRQLLLALDARHSLGEHPKQLFNK